MITDGHLHVSFTPDAIRQHFECYYDPESLLMWRKEEQRRKVYEFVMNADTDTLREIGEIAINDSVLWTAFNDVLLAAVHDVLKEHP